MRRLLNTQRKQLHDILVANGIDPYLSEWTHDQKGWTSNCTDTLEVGLCYFVISPDLEEIGIKCRPAPDGGIEYAQVHLTWNDVLLHFSSWAIHVKHELEQIDPWSEYSNFLPPDGLLTDEDNLPFSYVQTQRVESAINSLIGYLHENVEGYDQVANRFDPALNRMIEHAKSGLGRIDWKNQIVGLIIAICLALSLSPEAAGRIWKFWVDAASNVVMLLS